MVGRLSSLLAVCLASFVALSHAQIPPADCLTAAFDIYALTGDGTDSNLYVYYIEMDSDNSLFRIVLPCCEGVGDGCSFAIQGSSFIGYYIINHSFSAYSPFIPAPATIAVASVGCAPVFMQCSSTLIPRFTYTGAGGAPQVMYMTATQCAPGGAPAVPPFTTFAAIEGKLGKQKISSLVDAFQQAKSNVSAILSTGHGNFTLPLQAKTKSFIQQ